MNKLNRQHTEILEILENSPVYGMNSFQWRTRFIQLPVRIKEMKAMGYTIISQQNKNRSVNYILVSSGNSQALKPIVEPQNHDCDPENCHIDEHYLEYIKDNRKFFRHREEPEQLSL